MGFCRRQYSVQTSFKPERHSLLMGIALKSQSASQCHGLPKNSGKRKEIRSLSEVTPDIIYTIDTQGIFTYVNPAWERFWVTAARSHRKVFIDLSKERSIYIKMFKSIRDEGVRSGSDRTLIIKIERTDFQYQRRSGLRLGSQITVS